MNPADRNYTYADEDVRLPKGEWVTCNGIQVFRPAEDAPDDWRSDHPFRRRGKKPKCGTDSGYIAHRYRKQTICGDCREAHRIANAEREARRQNDRERSAA